MFLTLINLAFSHSGGTDSFGCHAGSQQYHCHNSKTVYIQNVDYSTPKEKYEDEVYPISEKMKMLTEIYENAKLSCKDDLNCQTIVRSVYLEKLGTLEKQRCSISKKYFNWSTNDISKSRLRKILSMTNNTLFNGYVSKDKKFLYLVDSNGIINEWKYHSCTYDAKEHYNDICEIKPDESLTAIFMRPVKQNKYAVLFSRNKSKDKRRLVWIVLDGQSERCETID